jgi:hypothetical protein
MRTKRLHNSVQPFLKESWLLQLLLHCYSYFITCNADFRIIHHMDGP